MDRFPRTANPEQRSPLQARFFHSDSANALFCVPDGAAGPLRPLLGTSLTCACSAIRDLDPFETPHPLGELRSVDDEPVGGPGGGIVLCASTAYRGPVCCRLFDGPRTWGPPGPSSRRP